MSRVLLVDDEEIHLRATAALLRRAGCHVTTALGGEQALELLAKDSFDAALVDLMMPRINGLELVRTIRDQHPHMRAVLTSSFPLSARQIERMGLGAVPFVPKPSPVHELLAALGIDPAQSATDSEPMARLAPSA